MPDARDRALGSRGWRLRSRIRDSRFKTVGPTVFRVRWQGGRPELVASLKGERPIDSPWLGLTPDGSLLVSNSANRNEVYALEWEEK